jgi:hypothetical protein
MALNESRSIGDPSGHVGDHNLLAHAVNLLNAHTVNVMDAAYGAKGDGLTDDTAAIQAAINAAQNLGTSGTVYFPETGHPYLISAALITAAQVRLVGEQSYFYGNNSQIKAMPGGNFTNGAIADKFMIKTPMARGGGGAAPPWFWHGGSLEHLSLDMNDQPGLGGFHCWQTGENSVIEFVSAYRSGMTPRTVTDGATTNTSTTLTSATAGFSLADVGGIVSGSGIPSTSARTVADGVTTSGSVTVTSATASFTLADVGAPITGAGIPGGATITAPGLTLTSVQISAPATATGSAISLTITQSIPTRVSLVNSATSITMSRAATATASGVSVTVNTPAPAVQFEGGSATGVIRSLNGSINAGPVLHLKNQGVGSWVIDSLSGDSNGGGLLRIETGGINQDPISILVNNIKAENFTEAGRMDPVIHLINCDMTSLIVNGGSNVTNYPETDVVRIDQSVGNGPAVTLQGLEAANPFNTQYANIIRDTATGRTIPNTYRGKRFPAIFWNREIVSVNSAFSSSGTVLGGSATDYLDVSSGSVTSTASGTGVGDKIALYQNLYGFGVQAGRIVAYLPAGTNGFAVRPASGTGNASSAADAVYLTTNGHIGAPGFGTSSAAAGSNAGTTPPAPVLAGSDTRGTVTFGTGTTPAAGNMAVVTFGTAYTSAPVVTVAAGNAATALLNPYVTSVGTGAFTVAFQTAPAASQANTIYAISYHVIG